MYIYHFYVSLADAAFIARLHSLTRSQARNICKPVGYEVVKTGMYTHINGVSIVIYFSFFLIHDVDSYIKMTD